MHSSPGFFNSGLTTAFFHVIGKVPDESVVVVYMAEYDQAHFLFWLFFPERMMQICQVSCLQLVGGFLVWCQLGCIQG